MQECHAPILQIRTKALGCCLPDTAEHFSMAHCGRWEGQLRDLPELQIQVRRSRRVGSVHRIWPTLDTAVTPIMNDASLNARHALFRTRRLIERIAKLYDLRLIPLARLRDF